MLPKKLNDFIRQFSRLPGIGHKTSERIGFHLVSADQDAVTALARSISELRAGIRNCSECGYITESDPCPVCSDGSRDRSILCVVENAMDIHYIESTNSYQGLYHVLGGVISPLNGVTPRDLRIEPLIGRLEGVRELIFATSATTEGDTTVLYIKELIKDRKIRTTHLARGIPVGTGLQFAGAGSLSQAIRSREEVK